MNELLAFYRAADRLGIGLGTVIGYLIWRDNQPDPDEFSNDDF